MSAAETARLLESPFNRAVEQAVNASTVATVAAAAAAAGGGAGSMGSAGLSALNRGRVKEKKVPPDVNRRPRFNYQSHSQDARPGSTALDDVEYDDDAPAPASTGDDDAYQPIPTPGSTQNTLTPAGAPWVWRRPKSYIRIVDEEEVPYVKSRKLLDKEKKQKEQWEKLKKERAKQMRKESRARSVAAAAAQSAAEAAAGGGPGTDGAGIGVVARALLKKQSDGMCVSC